jgi:DNA repair exonuclease SbcCD ATPase subunit
MSVTLEKLNFSNMYSYGKNISIELNKERITQLAAPNGSGKSSIALILQEILFNRNIKGVKKGDILNKYSKEKTWDATLSFSVDANNYVLEVVRSSTQTKVALLENGVDISEHKVLDTYKKLHSILGMEFEVFSQLTYQSSTDLLDFLKATDSNRKKFLINLFGFEKYLEIGDQLKQVTSEKDKDLVSLRGELKTVTNYLESVNLSEKKEFVAVPEVDEALEEQIISIAAAIENVEKDAKRIDKNNLNIKERDAIKFDVSMIAPKNPEVDSEIQYARDGANQSKRIVEETKKKLDHLDLSDVCYACHQSLDNSQSMAQKSRFEEEIALQTNLHKDFKLKFTELNNRKEEYTKALTAYNENQKAIEKFESLSNLIDSSIPKELPDKTELTRKEALLKSTLRNQKLEKSNAEKINEDVRLHNTKVDLLREEKEKFLVRQTSLNNDIVKAQHISNNLQILKKAFSASGIVAFKLENVAKDLEQTINKYLSVLSDGQFSVIFRLTGEKLNVVIINNGHEVTIESLSGGEFSRVQTSVLLAVRSTLSKIGGNSLNLLFLDEITGVLDESGKEKLFEVLSEEEGLNVFLISHDYNHPLIPKIEIVKENNISKIL